MFTNYIKFYFLNILFVPIHICSPVTRLLKVGLLSHCTYEDMSTRRHLVSVIIPSERQRMITYIFILLVTIRESFEC